MLIPTYIIGAGGLGRGVAETLKIITNGDRNWELIGFIDDDEEIYDVEMNGLNVVGNIQFLKECQTLTNVIIAIANPQFKSTIYNRLSLNPNLLFPNVIHPSVTINPTIKVGFGNIISENVSLSANIEIENFTLIHFNSSIGHDSKIADYATIYPGANLSGFVKMNTKAEIGSNACILPSIGIGKCSIVGAGALVSKDVESGTTVVGVPAVRINSLLECRSIEKDTI